jgi:mono/diheme cytochrome c family protein
MPGAKSILTVSVALFLLTASARDAGWRRVVAEHCLDCHDRDVMKGDLDLERLLNGRPGEAVGVWESVLKRVRAGQMPPPDKQRPSAADLANWRPSSMNTHAGIPTPVGRRPFAG